MSLSLYNASIPVFIRILGNLSAILEKGLAYAEAKKFDPCVLVNARLAPDMYPLSRQIQIATDVAKGCGARLSGIEVPVFEDNESTFPELQTRIQKTVDFLHSVDAEAINTSGQRTISLKVRGKEVNFQGTAYLLNFVLPNFYFHVTTAYDILRHNGVELGKRDYIGEPPLQ